MNTLNTFLAIRIKTVCLHIATWTLLILQELVVTSHFIRRPVDILLISVYYVFNISSFYVYLRLMNDLYAMPFWKAFQRVCYVLAVLAGFTVLKLGFEYLQGGIAYVRGFYMNDFSRCLYFLVLAVFYRVAGFMIHYRKRAAEVQNAFLRQQLQPHLLFNTLNFVYSTVEAQSDEAARVVWLLSDLMRFSLELPADAGMIPVADELAHVRQLIELNRLRYRDKLFLDTELAEFSAEDRVLPLIFMTLTENVFRHGDLSDARCPASITLRRKEDRLVMETLNRRAAPVPSTGIGLTNLRSRLAFAYGKDFLLDIFRDAQYFRVYLELPL